MFHPWRRTLSPSELRKVSRKRQPRRAPKNRFVPYLERLESRDCPSTILNVSKMLDNQSDATIAINPHNTQQMFVASTNFHGGFNGGDYWNGGTSPPSTNGLFFAYSSNGGTSWTTGVMATGIDDTEPGYGLPQGGHFPHAAFDQYGNLFLTYVTDGILFRGHGHYDSVSCTLTDNNANWFTNEWSNVNSPGGGTTTSAYTVFVGPNGKPTTVGSNMAHQLSACVTTDGHTPLPTGDYDYAIRNGNSPNFFANSIVVAQSIDGGTFSSQSNFTLLTFLGPFPGVPGPLIPLVATGPGFNATAFAGQSTGSNGSTSLNDTNQNWTANQFANELVTITAGTGAGQTRTISGNTSSTLTISSAWTTTPDATSSFEIVPSTGTAPVSGTSTGSVTGTSTGSNTSTTLNDTHQNWTTNQFATQLVRIISGTGVGQTRTVASNSSTQLIVTSAWSTIPDTTSKYDVGSDTSTTLNDTNQNWTPNAYAGDIVVLSDGTGAQQASVITSNTATQLTVSPAWGVLPNNITSYLLGPKSGSVWVGYELATTSKTAFSPYAIGAATFGLGLGGFNVGTNYVTSFYQPITLPPGHGENHSASQSGLAIGPGGQVLTSWVGSGITTSSVETAVAGGLVALQFTANTAAATTYMMGGVPGTTRSGMHLNNFGSIPALGQPTAPTLSQTSGGNQPATYYVEVAYLFGGPPGPASLESNFTVSANNLLQVSSPASVSGATGYNVYASTATGTEVLQNTSPVALGVNWTEPTTGLVTGTAAPPTQAAMNVDAAPQVAYDTDSNPMNNHYGRAYLVYTNSAGSSGSSRNDTNIFAMYSDNNGLSSWTLGNSGNQVDDDTGTNGHNSQFWPQAAVDPTTGKLAVTWYDARNDPNNALVQLYSAVSSDGGVSFAVNQQITAGQTNGLIPNLESSGTITSDSATGMTDSNQFWTNTTDFPSEMDWWKPGTATFAAPGVTTPWTVTAGNSGASIADNTRTALSFSNSWIPPAVGTTYTISSPYTEAVGRYTGLAFYNGHLWPAWADNSNSTGDNPNRTKGATNPFNVWQLNIYTVNVTVTAPSSPSRAAALVSGPAGSQPLTSPPEVAARDILPASIVQPTVTPATSTPSATADPAPRAAEQARINTLQPLFGSLKPDDHPLRVLHSKSASPPGSNLAELSIWETGIALDL